MAERKGRRPPEDLLLDKREVAQALSLPMKVIAILIHQGVLQPVTPASKKPLFHAADVGEVAKMVEEKVHLSTAFNRAQVAYSLSKRVERKLDDILELLGAKEQKLPTEEWDVIRIFNKVSNTLKLDLRTLSAADVMDWSKIFLAIDENYLMLAAHYLKTKEPWLQVLWLGQQISEKAPRELFTTEKDLEAAYSYFQFALRSFRQVAYFYCRIQKGATAANLQFPEVRDGDVTRAISRLVSMALADNIIQPGRRSSMRRRIKNPWKKKPSSSQYSH